MVTTHIDFIHPAAGAAAAGILAPDEDISRRGARAGSKPYVECIDGPYQVIRDKRRIMNMLRQVLDAGRPIGLTGRRVRTADSRLLSMDAAGGRILLRQVTNDASHSQLLLDGHVNITARHGNVPLLFTLDLIGSGSCDGIPCYMASIPDWMFFAQMRDSFRVCLPRSLDASLSFHVPQVGLVEARVLDISESGIGALLPAGLTRAVTANETYFEATLHMRDGTLHPLGINVRYVGSAMGGPQRIGAALDLSTASQRQNLRRLVLRHQPLQARQE